MRLHAPVTGYGISDRNWSPIAMKQMNNLSLQSVSCLRSYDLLTCFNIVLLLLSLHLSVVGPIYRPFPLLSPTLDFLLALSALATTLSIWKRFTPCTNLP